MASHWFVLFAAVLRAHVTSYYSKLMGTADICVPFVPFRYNNLLDSLLWLGLVEAVMPVK